MNYQHSFFTQASQTQIIDALTRSIPAWWTEDFTGDAAATGKEFTIRFGNTVKTFEVAALTGSSVVWTCKAAHIDLATLRKKDEWTSTTIIWSLEPEGRQKRVSIVHQGLTPEIECYDVCERGWNTFLSSLWQFLESGQGHPHKKQHLEESRSRMA